MLRCNKDNMARHTSFHCRLTIAQSEELNRALHFHVLPNRAVLDARLIVSRIVLDALEELKMTYPKTSAKRRRELPWN